MPPSDDEINAAFDAIEPDLHNLVRQFVPGFFQSQAMAALDSKAGVQDVVTGLRKALTAAERVRAKAGPPEGVEPTLISSITIEFSTALKGSGKIRWLTRSQFSHCDIDVGYGLLGASDSPEAPCLRGNPRGVAVRPYAYQAFGRRHQAVIATPLAPYIIRKLETQLGKPFDHKALYAIFMPWMRASSVLFDPAMWYCAELVLWAFDGDHGPERKRFFPYQL